MGSEPSSATTTVHVSRELAAPRDEVFRTWTEPDLFKRWFTPPGNASVTADLDVRPGGAYRITVERTELVPGTSYIVGNYLEVDPPERLEIEDFFDDELGPYLRLPRWRGWRPSRRSTAGSPSSSATWADPPS